MTKAAQTNFEVINSYLQVANKPKVIEYKVANIEVIVK